MKRSVACIFQTMMLTVISLVFLMSGSYRAQNSAQASPTAVPQKRVGSGESIGSRMFTGMPAHYFAVTVPFANRTETSMMDKTVVRSEPWHLGALQGGLELMAAASTEVTEEQLTVSSITVDQPFFTLVNDIPITLTLWVDPPVAVNVRVHFLREGMVETIHSVNIIPLVGTALSSDGTTLTTDSTGMAHFQLQAGYGGQGRVWCAFETESGAALMIDGVITNPKRCDCCCGRDNDCCADSQDTGNNAVALYSGERMLRLTALTVPGLAFDYQAKLTYRSQVSNLRDASTNDFGTDWSLSYINDRLKPDGNNVIVFRDSLRTDMFIGAAPGVFLSPTEYYEQLRINAVGDYELRSEDGMVKTYHPFVRDSLGELTPTSGKLKLIEDRNGNRMRFIYEKPDGLSKFVLTKVIDTEGRNFEYHYFPEGGATAGGSNPGQQGRLKKIVDFAGREIKFDYDNEGNLISVTSPTAQGTPTGKTFRYAYTREQDLPGSGTTMGGSTGINRQRLLHNLVAIAYPNETAAGGGTPISREILTYNADPNDPDNFDRVRTYTIGGTNGTGVPAGGTITYSYESVAPKPATHIPTPNDLFLKSTVADRRGNVTVYQNSAYDTLIEKDELTRGFRTNEPTAFVTKAQYNSDKRLVHAVLPEGNAIDHIFDERSFRFQQGNEIRMVRTADAARGGDQTALATETTFEPIYQQPAAITDPRGLDPSFVPPILDPRGRSQRERYTTRYFFDYQEGNPVVILLMLAAKLGTSLADVQARLNAAGVMLGLGDLNGDGDTSPQVAGNIVRKEEPMVVLLSGSHQAAIHGGDQIQGIITCYRYNQFGQMTSRVDPEGNFHTYAYFPQTDPDGDGNVAPPPADGRTLDALTGGYLKEEIIDAVSDPSPGNFSDPARDNATNPPPVNIRMAYTYDVVGNRTSITDGRGILTRHVVNELNQVVQIIRASAVPASGSGNLAEPLSLTPFAYRENIFYDANNNVTRREVEDRGNTSNTGGFVEYTYKYDILDDLIETSQEVSVTEMLVTRNRYDANQNLVLVVLPEGNATTSRHDERDLLFQSDTGALTATAETLGAPPGPYNPRGGVPSTLTFNYDSNRNLIEQVDAADTDGSTDNGSAIAGIGDVTTFRLDGFDRRVATIGAVGNEMIINYDPASNIVKETRRGPVGGVSPKNNFGTSNVNLSVTEKQYDELNRLFQEDRLLFISPGVSTQRPPDVTDGRLTPGDNKVTTRQEYDRDSRLTFRTQDDLQTYSTGYDGAGRVIKTIDAEGNTVEMAYDGDNNNIEKLETDVSQVPGVANEKFVTTNFFDSLNRLQHSVDNIGQTTDYRYDSRSNLVAMADAKGPVSGTIARRVFSGGSLTVNTINNFGNVTVYSYDGINRKTLQEQILTASGQGDGAHIGADIVGVKTTTPTPDPSQGGGDGKITIRTEWDRNSLLKSQTDDNGNQTQHIYDNLNRPVTETKGVCTSPALADRCDPPTSTRYEYDPDGNVVRLTDENGSITACTFDAINRRTACNVTRAPGVVGTTAVGYEYDGLSRMTRATDNNEPATSDDDSVITFAHDSLSRVIEETQKIGSLPAKAISSSWFADDHRVGLTYPNGRALEYDFDELDQMKTVGDKGAPKPIASYNYIGVGRVAERRYPINGTRLSYLSDTGTSDIGYDGLRRTVQLRHLRDDNSPIAGFTYSYDRMNNKLTEGKQLDVKNDETYDYDAAYRLIKFDRAAGITPIQSKWKLDGAGNWRKVDNEKRKHSSFNEIISRKSGGVTTQILSDNNGNETDNGVLTLKWDYRNRLREVVRKPATTVYSYDAEGRRIRKVVTTSSTIGTRTSTTDFYLDGWQEIEERNGDDRLVQQYVYGRWIDEPLALDVDTNSDGIPDERHFYHEDAKRSIAAMTDNAGSVAERYIYDAYGSALITDAGGMARSQSAVGNPYLFTGRRLDRETGFYYLRNRYLDSQQGRFIQRDPIGIWINQWDLGNSYAYVGNNPVNWIDPWGLEEERLRGLPPLERSGKVAQPGPIRGVRPIEPGTIGPARDEIKVTPIQPSKAVAGSVVIDSQVLRRRALNLSSSFGGDLLTVQTSLSQGSDDLLNPVYIPIPRPAQPLADHLHNCPDYSIGSTLLTPNTPHPNPPPWKTKANVFDMLGVDIIGGLPPPDNPPPVVKGEFTGCYTVGRNAFCCTHTYPCTSEPNGGIGYCQELLCIDAIVP